MCVVRNPIPAQAFPDARFLLYVRDPSITSHRSSSKDRIRGKIEKSDPIQIEIIELTGTMIGPNQVIANVGVQELRRVRRLFDDNRWAVSRARYSASRLRIRRRSARPRSGTGTSVSARPLRRPCSDFPRRSMAFWHIPSSTLRASRARGKRTVRSSRSPITTNRHLTSRHSRRSLHRPTPSPNISATMSTKSPSALEPKRRDYSRSLRLLRIANGGDARRMQHRLLAVRCARRLGGAPSFG